MPNKLTHKSDHYRAVSVCLVMFKIRFFNETFRSNVRLGKGDREHQ